MRPGGVEGDLAAAAEWGVDVEPWGTVVMARHGYGLRVRGTRGCPFGRPLERLLGSPRSAGAAPEARFRDLPCYRPIQKPVSIGAARIANESLRRAGG